MCRFISVLFPHSLTHTLSLSSRFPLPRLILPIIHYPPPPSSWFKNSSRSIFFSTNFTNVTNSSQNDTSQQTTPTSHTHSEQWSSVSFVERLPVSSRADPTSSLTFIKIVSFTTHDISLCKGNNNPYHRSGYFRVKIFSN